MYLKSLSLKGFKSFADPTTLEFEPGVTVIVGPNGSGKSNVVDAVAWVLGAQGPRVVRSSKMDDVIFAGTAKRPALGRAEVSLTIDNSSGRLPVDLAEVTITRTLFRSGESEYSLNGAPCRLLDVQELLSDAGVGRQQHVIMGQGQLDAVLQARPEDRRAVIEEAAGVLKFRRRRERAERRIEATESNLMRLQDLHREVRRQLRPLERQAEAARRHDSLALELRALRLYVAGREVSSLEQRIAHAQSSRMSLGLEENRLQATLTRLDETVAVTEASLSAVQVDEVVPMLGLAERLAERARGVANVIAERQRSVAAALVQGADADVVASLESELARVESELAQTLALTDDIAPEAVALEADAADLEAAEAAWAERDRRHGPEALSAASDGVVKSRRARDGVLAQLAAAREALAAASERESSLRGQEVELEASAAAARAEIDRYAASTATVTSLLSAAEKEERDAATAVLATEAMARELVEHAQSLAARADALQLALDEAHARAGVDQLAGCPGVLGTLLDVVELVDGCELAFEASVADALRAVVVGGAAQARVAIEHLREARVDGSVVLAEARIRRDPVPVAPAGTVPLRSCVRAIRPGVDSLLDRLLAGVVLCRGDLKTALDLVATLPSELTVVTPDGDRFSADEWRLGAGRSGATRAALDAVRVDAGTVSAEATQARALAEEARRAHARTRSAVAEVGRRFATAVAEERQARSQLEEQERRLQLIARQIPVVHGAVEECRRQVELHNVALESREVDLDGAERREREAAEVAQSSELERRQLDERGRSLASRSSDFQLRSAGLRQRRGMLEERRAQIEARLAGYENERRQAAARRKSHELATVTLERLAALAVGARAELDRLLVTLRQRRSLHDATVSSTSNQLLAARSERARAEKALVALRESIQRSELELTELRVRLEAAIAAVRQDLDSEPAAAVAAICPELPSGTSPGARVRELERDLRLLGPVNPLALDELAALEERDRFLAGQLEDVRAARRELSKVIRAVDDEIVNGFTAAFSDVARHFEVLFSTLFPGGAGNLTLVDPSDLLATGVEIEARPAGRNVRRLSLLSGGERSLVALAFLFAVFRSRPSPFYLMDEVEAALDDVNLHRFLALVEEFRGEAQLLVVSHQKRTMESADVLYGVSLQPGGASKVVSERLDTSRGSRTG
ncbi:MAG: chromosome segregation protein SMC [Acidimicrobiales bacterium]